MVGEFNARGKGEWFGEMTGFCLFEVLVNKLLICAKRQGQSFFSVVNVTLSSNDFERGI